MPYFSKLDYTWQSGSTSDEEQSYMLYNDEEQSYIFKIIISPNLPKFLINDVLLDKGLTLRV